MARRRSSSSTGERPTSGRCASSDLSLAAYGRTSWRACNSCTTACWVGGATWRGRRSRGASSLTRWASARRSRSSCSCTRSSAAGLEALPAAATATSRRRSSSALRRSLRIGRRSAPSGSAGTSSRQSSSSPARTPPTRCATLCAALRRSCSSSATRTFADTPPRSASVQSASWCATRGSG